MKNKRPTLLLLALVFTAISSCKKLEYDNGFTTFAEVYFNNNNVIGLNNLGVRSQGEPIDWEPGTGKIKVPIGQQKFEFYDKKSGKVLAEKTVDIIDGKPENFIIFRPSEDDPVAILDPNAQADETAPSDGFMKIKIANYAKLLLPFDKMDIIVIGINNNFEFTNLDTLDAVSQNLGDEVYRIVPTGGTDILAYTFSFRKHGSQEIVKDLGGINNYFNQGNFLYPDQIIPYPTKRIYTIFLTAFETGYEYEGFIKKDDKFYDILPSMLFSN